MKMAKLIKGLRKWITRYKFEITITLVVVLLLNSLGVFGNASIEGAKGKRAVKGGGKKGASVAKGGASAAKGGASAAKRRSGKTGGGIPQPTRSMSSVVPKSDAHMRWEQEINFQQAKRLHRDNERSRGLRQETMMREEAEQQRLDQNKRRARRRQVAREEAKQARADAKRRKKEDEEEAKREKEEAKKERERKKKEQEKSLRDQDGGGEFEDVGGGIGF